MPSENDKYVAAAVVAGIFAIVVAIIGFISQNYHEFFGQTSLSTPRHTTEPSTPPVISSSTPIQSTPVTPPPVSTPSLPAEPHSGVAPAESVSSSESISPVRESKVNLLPIRWRQATPSQSEKATAVHYLELAKSEIEKVADTRNKGELLYDIVTLQAIAGNISTAKATIRAISGESYRAFALGTIAAAQVTANDLAGARKTINEIPSKNTDAKADALYKFAVAQAKAGDFAGAMETTRTITNEAFQFYALKIIAIAEALSGDIVSAKATASTSEGEVDFILGDITAIQAETGDLEGAKATAQSISKDKVDDRAQAYMRIAIALKARGDPVGARQYSALALASASMIVDPNLRNTILADLGGNLADIGDISSASKMAGSLSGGEKDKVTRAIAIAQAEAGNFATAKLTAKNLSNEDRFYALRNIAAAEVKAGELEDAKAIAMTLSTENRYRGRAFGDIARELDKKDGSAMAENWVEKLADPLDRSACFVALAASRLAPHTAWEDQ